MNSATEAIATIAASSRVGAGRSTLLKLLHSSVILCETHLHRGDEQKLQYEATSTRCLALRNFIFIRHDLTNDTSLGA